MPIELKPPIIYLITGGNATNRTLEVDCGRILALVESAVAAGVSLIQIREKDLCAQALYDLTRHAVKLTDQSSTRILVNDRADIAAAARADGVHLTSTSLDANIVRSTFGDEFLIGVSTHSAEEARSASDLGADFAVLGPVFETPSKSSYGLALGVDAFRSAVHLVKPFPLIALGGVTLENSPAAFDAGASGVAGIRAFSDPQSLKATVWAMRDKAVLR